MELEYRYVIPSENINLIPPKDIGVFELAKSYQISLEDILIERRGHSLKKEKIGIRARKTGTSYEVTYKKFLGEERGAKKFDEHNAIIDQATFERIKSGDFDFSALPIADEISRTGDPYILVEVINSRSVYIYAHEKASLELVVEDITYIGNNRTVQDAMMELEIKSDLVDKSEEIKFVADTIKALYGGVESNEGKNSRAMKLLEIEYE